MQLMVRDVAKLLSVSEKTIYRWVKSGKLPAYRVHDRYRFNRSELLEWATERRIGISSAVLDEPSEGEGQPPKLLEALERGGIRYRLGGSSKEEVFASLIEAMQLPEGIDHPKLLRALLAREELSSTGIGDGVAIPHLRGPVVLQVEHPLLALGFLEHPIDFKAIDGQRVHALFFLICPTIRSHLQMLSRLSYALQDPDLKDAVRDQALRPDLLREFARVERVCEERIAS